MCDVIEILAKYSNQGTSRLMSIAEMADYMNEDAKKLARQLNPNDKYNFPAKSIISFTRVTGDFELLDHIEQRVGRIAMPLVGQGHAGLTIKSVADITERFGRAMSALAEALEDGDIDEDEERICSARLIAVQQALSKALLALNKK